MPRKSSIYTNTIYILIYIVFLLLIQYIVVRFSYTNKKKDYYLEHTDASNNGVQIKRFIDRIDLHAPEAINDIPLDIYRTWHTDTISLGMAETIYRSALMSPEFNNHFFTEEDCLKFIQENFEPDVAKAFQCLKPIAYKADLWRYCILYKKGGVYIDIKMELHQPLLDIVEKYPIFFPHDGGSTRKKSQLTNGFIVSPPNNIVFRACIDAIVKNCREKEYTNHFLDVTGPHLLGRMADIHLDKNYIHSIQSKLKLENKILVVRLNDITLLKEYESYRIDQQKTQKIAHYAVLWDKRDIYDTSIVFDK